MRISQRRFLICYSVNLLSPGSRFPCKKLTPVFLCSASVCHSPSCGLQQLRCKFSSLTVSFYPLLWTILYILSKIFKSFALIIKTPQKTYFYAFCGTCACRYFYLHFFLFFLQIFLQTTEQHYKPGYVSDDYLSSPAVTSRLKQPT